MAVGPDEGRRCGLPERRCFVIRRITEWPWWRRRPATSASEMVHHEEPQAAIHLLSAIPHSFCAELFQTRSGPGLAPDVPGSPRAVPGHDTPTGQAGARIQIDHDSLSGTWWSKHLLHCRHGFPPPGLCPPVTPWDESRMTPPVPGRPVGAGSTQKIAQDVTVVFPEAGCGNGSDPGLLESFPRSGGLAVSPHLRMVHNVPRIPWP